MNECHIELGIILLEVRPRWPSDIGHIAVLNYCLLDEIIDPMFF